MMRCKRGISGFTLIELMIVVAIIAIIAAIAIPNLLRSRMSANEVSAIAALRALAEAQSTYRDTAGAGTYATLVELNVAAPPFIDATLAAGTLRGYTMIMVVPPTADVWGAVATPNVLGSTGNRGFFVDESGLIHVTTDGSAPGPADPPLR